MKRVKKLLILLLVLAVLCGATAYLTGLDLNGEAEEPDTSVTMMTLDSGAVTALQWENLQEELLYFTRSDGAWAYQADGTFPVDDEILEGMVSAVSEIVASRVIEEPEDMAEYGLNEPLCVISVTAGDTSYVLELGDETGLGGERYASIGDGKVYLVDMDLLAEFDYELYDLVLEEELPELYDVTALSIDARTQQLTVQYLEDSGLAYSDEYVWFLEDGTALDTQLTEELLAYYQEFVWIDCVNYRADEAALESYGLDDPTAVVTVSYEESCQISTDEVDEDGNAVFETVTVSKVFVLEIGDYTSDGTCYARLAGSDMVYTIEGVVSDAALYTTADTLLPDEVIALDFDDMTAMEITLDGETYSIRAELLSETDDEGNTTEKTVYYLGDRQVYLEDTIELLEDLSSSGYATGMDPEREEEISFVIFREHEHFPEVELSFYRYDSTSCITRLNGQSTVFVLREEILELITEVESVVLE